MKIREAKKKDIANLVEVMLIIFQDMELNILKKMSLEELREILLEAFQDENYRYSYTHALVAESKGEILGAVYCYDSKSDTVTDTAFEDILKRKKATPERLFFAEETDESEWYLDSIVVFENARGQGVGRKLLVAAIEHTRENGATRVGLNVDENNPKAKKLYETIGFKSTREVILAGHLYQHMVVEVS